MKSVFMRGAMDHAADGNDALQRKGCLLSRPNRARSSCFAFFILIVILFLISSALRSETED